MQELGHDKLGLKENLPPGGHASAHGLCQRLCILRMKPQAVWSKPLVDSAVSSPFHQASLTSQPHNLLPQWSSPVFVISIPSKDHNTLKNSMPPLII